MTGPKISSLAIFMSSVTSLKTVGSMKYPLSPHLFPPHNMVAPSSCPFLMYPMMVLNYVWLTYGPYSVSLANGSPILTLLADSTAFLQNSS